MDNTVVNIEKQGFLRPTQTTRPPVKPIRAPRGSTDSSLYTPAHVTIKKDNNLRNFQEIYKRKNIEKGMYYLLMKTSVKRKKIYMKKGSPKFIIHIFFYYICWNMKRNQQKAISHLTGVFFSYDFTYKLSILLSLNSARETLRTTTTHDVIMRT